jgi:hypothetical protein
VRLIDNGEQQGGDQDGHQHPDLPRSISRGLKQPLIHSGTSTRLASQRTKAQVSGRATRKM